MSAPITVTNLEIFDPASLDSTLRQGGNPLAVFREARKQGDERLKQRFYDGVPAAELVSARARFIDQLLRRAWRRCAPQLADAALIAVGGYGRGELHPASDIDIMILLATDDHEAHLEPIEQFLMFLWDIGLEVGHSVRSVEDCYREGARDITVATNLMEARLLDGPPDLFETMRKTVGPDRIWPSREFFEAKWQEQVQRHRKFHDTAYNLEPNVKEGPGGLRDIQMIGWVAKRHFGVTTLHDLVAHGFLTETEYQALKEGQNFLWWVRLALHVLTGRREDRLVFDHQRTLAELYGYKDENANLAVEQFMKRYYRTIMELSRLNEMLLQLFQEAILYADESCVPVAINKRFQSRKGFVEVTRANVFRRYPFALLEIFLILQQHPELKGVRASTIRLIRDHRHLINDQFRNDLRCRTLFMEILRQPRGITHELRRMNRYGVLAAYLPAFAHVVGQMQYDLFHVYTVDEHSLFVIRNLRRFTLPEKAHELPNCSALIQRIPKPELLYIAGLFHDIAKGRGGDHSVLGAQDAETFCLHHGLSQYDANLVAWLVRNHLIMSMTAQRRDISDPDVINDFARQVGNPTRLDYLYLLTVADIRATNPNLWNSWKGALLLELHRATKNALRRGLERPLEQDEWIQETEQGALEALEKSGADLAQVKALWVNFSEDYFLRHSTDEIVWHTQAILDVKPEDLPLILVRQETERGSTEVFIYAQEQRLFALTTSVLDQLGLTIVDARIITTRSGYTLSSYLVLEESGAPIANPYRIQEILNALHDQLKHPDAPPATVSRRPQRLVKYFSTPTRVVFYQDEQQQRTVMEVTATDRPGLLSRIGRALSECGACVRNAKVATIGARVEDLFYITDDQDQPIVDEQQLACLREAIKRHVDNSG